MVTPTGADMHKIGPTKRRNCKCAWMPCGHCRKHHNNPDGSCSRCSAVGKTCKGFI